MFLNSRINNWLIIIRFKIKFILKKDEKIFVIGRNKTGTTSMKHLFEGLGYCVGDQEKGELFIDDYAKRDFNNILSYCDTAEVFQDAPFSWPETYKHVYKKYPKAKYILLERESSHVWFSSLVRFHRKIVKGGRYVDADDLKNYRYRRKGFLWQVAQAVYGVDEATLYDKDIYIKNYEVYNSEVKEFFKDKNNFLNIVLSSPEARTHLAGFLSRPISKITIPHSNISE